MGCGISGIVGIVGGVGVGGVNLLRSETRLI